MSEVMPSFAPEVETVCDGFTEICRQAGRDSGFCLAAGKALNGGTAWVFGDFCAGNALNGGTAPVLFGGGIKATSEDLGVLGLCRLFGGGIKAASRDFGDLGLCRLSSVTDSKGR